MRIIVCVDENGGMMFNKRRQSRDRLLIADVTELTAGHNLCMNAYSSQLFDRRDISVDEEFLSKAQSLDFCFVENQSVQPYLDEVGEVVLYRWNRKYPADFYFDVDLSTWIITDKEEFPGSSHEKITREIYIKREEKE